MPIAGTSSVVTYTTSPVTLAPRDLGYAPAAPTVRTGTAAPGSAPDTLPPASGPAPAQPSGQPLTADELLRIISPAQPSPAPPAEAAAVLDLSPQARELQAALDVKTEAMRAALAAFQDQGAPRSFLEAIQGDASWQLLLSKLGQQAEPAPAASGAPAPAAPSPGGTSPALPAGAEPPASMEDLASPTGAQKPLPDPLQIQTRIGQSVENLLQAIKASAVSLTEKVPDLFKFAPAPAAATGSGASAAASASSVANGSAPANSAASPAAQPFMAALFTRLGATLPGGLQSIFSSPAPAASDAAAFLFAPSPADPALPVQAVLEGLRQLDSLAKLVDAHLLKTDQIRSSSPLVASLLSEAPVASPAAAVSVTGTLRAPAQSSAPAAPPAQSPAAASAALPASSAPAESAALGQRLGQMVGELGRLGDSLTPGGRQELARITDAVRQIQGALQGGKTSPASLAGLVSSPAASAPVSAAAPSAPSRDAILQVIGRGLVFELEVKGSADLDATVDRLQKMGFVTEQIKDAGKETLRLRVTMPGQKSEPPAAAPKAEPGRAEPAVPPKAKAAAPAPESRPNPAATVDPRPSAARPAMDSFTPIFTRGEGRADRAADWPQSQPQSAPQPHPEQVLQRDPTRMSPAAPQKAALAQMANFFGANRESIVEGRDFATVPETIPPSRQLEYNPIEVVPPSASAQTPFVFVPIASSPISDAQPVQAS